MLNQNINAILHGLGKTVVPSIILMLGSVLKLILNTILVQINPSKFIFGGTAGAAFSTVVSHIFTCVISMYLVKKNVNIQFGVVDIVKPIIATLLMGASTIFIYNKLLCIISKKMCIIITLLIAITIYFVFILILKFFSEEEIIRIPHGKSIYIILRAIGIYK